MEFVLLEVYDNGLECLNRWKGRILAEEMARRILFGSAVGASWK